MLQCFTVRNIFRVIAHPKCLYIFSQFLHENVYKWSDRPLPTLNLLNKGKGAPRTGHEGPEGEYRYSPTLSSPRHLDGGGSSAPRPGRFTSGKTLYPLYRRLGRPQGQFGRVRKISPRPGFDPRTVQPVASRYTNWAIPAHGFVFSVLILSETIWW